MKSTGQSQLNIVEAV